MLLSIRNLRIAFRLEGKLSVPVRGVSFDIPANGRVALVGESGCGKSLTALAVGGLVDRAEITGEIVGRPRISYIFQNPMQSLNPVMRIGKQIEEARAERKMNRRSPACCDDAVVRRSPGAPCGNSGDVNLLRVRTRAERLRNLPCVCDDRSTSPSTSTSTLLASVDLPAETARKYPCQLSGGQQQRAMIAMALAAEPDLLIADEPTTALDVTTQKDVLNLVDRIADERGMAVLLITHNLGLVAEHSRFVNVMYAGEIVEAGPVKDVLGAPVHPYTRGLIAAVPDLDAPKDAPLADIPGTVPPPTDWPTGCAFHPRCPKATPDCAVRVSPACLRLARGGEI